VYRYAGSSSACIAQAFTIERAPHTGFSAKYVKSHEAPVVSDFLQRLRLQQLRLKMDLRGSRYK